MASDLEAKVIQDIKNRLTDKTICPEPQYSNFHKFLATHVSNSSQNEEKEAPVYLANSRGIQLRNDVQYNKQMRDNPIVELQQNYSPVLNQAHLSPFKDSEDLQTKLIELPSEWTVIQITQDFKLFDADMNMKQKYNHDIIITRFPCGDLAKMIEPYYIKIKPNRYSKGSILDEVQDLIKTRQEFYKTGSNQPKLREEYNNSDNNLATLVNELDNFHIKEWRCLLGGRTEDKTLEDSARKQVREAIENFFTEQKLDCKYDEKCADLVYQATLAAHLMKDKEILSVVMHALHKGDATITPGKDHYLLMESLKLLNIRGNCAMKRARKNPVILIVDHPFELIPWEMSSLLSGQPAIRVASLHMLYALYKYHEESIVDGYKILPIDCGFCLINPGKDLKDCEKNIKEHLKKGLSWIDAEIGVIPDPKQLTTRFQDYCLYLYCGHGSGAQYLSSNDLKRAFIKGMSLLFGCSSNVPKNTGGRTPCQNDTYTYLTNGCPCTIGCLYDVSSSDADKACIDIMSNILPTVNETGSQKTVNEPKEQNVLKALNSGKSWCTKYWTASALVARGIPCKTFVGSSEKETILKKLDTNLL